MQKLRQLIGGVLMLMVLFALPNAAFAELDIPEPIGFVNDFENILVNDEELESKLAQFATETSNEIVVVTVSDFQGYYIEEFAVELFEKWGIGTEENDNGVLVIISDAMRESRIEVGYGLEGAISDAFSGRIQDDEMIPYFKEGDYSTGVSKGVDALILASKDEYVPSSSSSNGISGLFENGTAINIAIIVLLFGFDLIAYSKSWWLGGVIGSIIGFIFWGWIGGVFAGFLGLIVDFVLSLIFGGKGGRSRGMGRAFGNTAMRSFGRSSSGGSSFGGFSGGSSGGGGSSRSW